MSFSLYRFLVVFFAAFLAGAFLTAALRAGAFFADFLAVDFFAAFLAGAFLAVDFFAAFLAGLLAVAFFVAICPPVERVLATHVHLGEHSSNVCGDTYLLS